MTNRPKIIGTRGETALVRHAHTRGFPAAERLALAGALDQGDVRLCPGVIAEVKAGAAAQKAGPTTLRRWAVDTERERVNAGAGVGLLVVQRLDRRTPGPGGWLAVLPLLTVVDLVDYDSAHILRDPDVGGRHRTLLAASLWSTSLDEALHLLRWGGYGDTLGLGLLEPTPTLSSTAGATL